MNLLDVYGKVDPNKEDRSKNDWYPTPPIAVYSLLKMSNVPDALIEPCAGRGDIAKELERNGKKVLAFDLHSYDNSLVEIATGVDYLKLSKQNVEGLITNPPYKNDLPYKMVRKAITEYSYVAMLLRLTFLEGMARYHFFKENPPSEVFVFSDRINFTWTQDCATSQLGGMICYAWFIWDYRFGKPENTRLDWILAKNNMQEWIANNGI